MQDVYKLICYPVIGYSYKKEYAIKKNDDYIYFYKDKKIAEKHYNQIINN